MPKNIASKHSLCYNTNGFIYLIFSCFSIIKQLINNRECDKMILKFLSYMQTNFKQHKTFILYFSISIFVTIIDVIICHLCEFFFSVVTANTIGVIIGFIIQYSLTSRHVYNSKNMRTLIIFFTTFLMGLVLANSIVYFSRQYLFHNSVTFYAFIISKGLSVAIPFFFMYYLRKILIKAPNIHSTPKEN